MPPDFDGLGAQDLALLLIWNTKPTDRALDGWRGLVAVTSDDL